MPKSKKSRRQSKCPEAAKGAACGQSDIFGLNRNKQSIALDMREPSKRNILAHLANNVVELML